MAGRTLATRILQAFYTNIDTQGSAAKMTLLFGGYEPMVAFAAFAGLISAQNDAFHQEPDPAASFIFELYTLESQIIVDYPQPSDLYVRFKYSNGTGPYSSLVEYAMFGLSPSQAALPLTDFITQLESFMIFNHQDWCTTCASFSVFCPAFDSNDTPNNPSTGSQASSRIHPAIAGLIGAVVALAAAGLILVALMLFAGVRLNRMRRKNKLDLAGFKRGEKMASDQDLVLPKTGAGVVVEHTSVPTAAAFPRERVGSWELKDQLKAQEAQNGIHTTAFREHRPSFEDDDINIHEHSDPIKPHDHV